MLLKRLTTAQPFTALGSGVRAHIPHLKTDYYCFFRYWKKIREKKNVCVCFFLSSVQCQLRIAFGSHAYTHEMWAYATKLTVCDSDATMLHHWILYIAFARTLCDAWIALVSATPNIVGRTNFISNNNARLLWNNRKNNNSNDNDSTTDHMLLCPDSRKQRTWSE